MIGLLTIWLVLFGVCLFMVWRRDGSGTLPLAYFIGLSVIHVPGAINYLSNDNGLKWRDETLIGFEVTLVGIAAFLVGIQLKRHFSLRVFVRGGVSNARAVVATPGAELVGYVPTMLGIGLVSFFVGIPALSFIPSATPFVTAFGSLVIMSLWIYVFNSAINPNIRTSVYLSIILPALPFSTLLFGGFAGFGIYWIIAIVSMYFLVSRRRWLLISVFPFLAWFGLSIGAAYFESREQIRKSVWYDNASTSARTEQILRIFDNIRPYDPSDPEQAVYIDGRLNQNYLIGIGVNLHRDGVTDLAYGGTIPFWVFIPRAVWPNKPDIGGGGDVVTKFTQLEFNKETSVGSGQPLEFYANFGLLGVIFGFVAFGIVVAHHDNGLSQGLRRQNLREVLVFGLPGLTLLAPGNNLVEILVSFVAALFASRLLAWGLPQIFVKTRVNLTRAEQRRRAVGSGQSLNERPRQSR